MAGSCRCPDSNNEEIRILKEKHKALWKFFVLIDRAVWDKHESECVWQQGVLGVTARLRLRIADSGAVGHFLRRRRGR